MIDAMCHLCIVYMVCRKTLNCGTAPKKAAQVGRPRLTRLAVRRFFQRMIGWNFVNRDPKHKKFARCELLMK